MTRRLSRADDAQWFLPGKELCRHSLHTLEQDHYSPHLYLDHSSLTDDSGRVFMQVFFYGKRERRPLSYARFHVPVVRAKPRMRPNEDHRGIRNGSPSLPRKGTRSSFFANSRFWDDDPDAKRKRPTIISMTSTLNRPSSFTCGKLSLK